MYLSTLSGTMIALGLMGGVDDFGDAFVAFTVVILPVVLFVGIATFLRMAAANYHDATCVLGMNRIRGAYLELAPDLEPYFVMGVHDDARGVAQTMAIPPGMPAIVHVIAATPFMIAVLNAVVAGAIAAIAADRLLGLVIIPTLGVATFAAAGTLAAQLRVVAGNMRRGSRAIRSLFPTPSASDAP